MARIDESVNQSQMQGILTQGYDLLDGDASITFIKYTRFVLPTDGYIFWLLDGTAQPLYVQGSIHYSTDQEQREDETIGINRVVFTTNSKVQEFNALNNNSVYIGQIDNLTFAFTSTGKFYQMADLWHYHGDAIYPAMLSQIISSLPATILPVATNSLPLWLSLNSFVSPVPSPLPGGTFYPSFLLPSNIPPPYISINVMETTPMGSDSEISSTSSSAQLMKDKIRLTTYGLGNDAAIDLKNFIIQYSLNYDNIGILNIPKIQEEKRTQSELGILANKKIIDIEISYYQRKAAAVARQLINTALATLSIGNNPIA